MTDVIIAGAIVVIAAVAVLLALLCDGWWSPHREHREVDSKGQPRCPGCRLCADECLARRR